jgi:glycosyltransferase involved in cell wall biosynthesis
MFGAMRILLVGDYPRDARLGSAKVLFKLQDAFRELGHTCDLLLADDLGSRPANPHVRRALAPLLALAAVRRAARRNGAYDVVDAASAEALWIARMRGVAGCPRAAVIARSNGLEQLDYQRMLDDHDHGLRRKPASRRWLYPLIRLSQVAAAARAADRLLLLNEVDREFAIARRWKPAHRIDVVAHGVSDIFLRQSANGAGRGRGILFCGSWAAVKGVPYLAQAFSELIASGVSAHLTVLGGAVDDETILGAFAPAARAHVTVRPRAAAADVIDAYRTHDMLVSPSTYEGFGMVVVEAMSQHLPIVATPVGCARTLVEDGRTGLIVPPRDAGALAAAMRRLLDDCALRARLADAAYERVAGMTWRNTALATLDVYARARERAA